MAKQKSTGCSCCSDWQADNNSKGSTPRSGNKGANHSAARNGEHISEDSHTHGNNAHSRGGSSDHAHDKHSQGGHNHSNNGHNHSQGNSSHSHDGHDHGHSHGGGEGPAWKRYLPAMISFVMLAAGILIGNYATWSFITEPVKIIWYVLAYLPVGLPVMKDAWFTITRKDFFNEFTLMTVATIGAFAIGEYPEGVAVMLFYSVGELFQDAAVNKARRNIKNLLDIRPATASVLRNGKYSTVAPEEVAIGETIEIKAGEKVPLDGIMLSAKSRFNTAALTGESKPRSIVEGEQVLAGMVNIDNVITVKVEKEYADSSLARILEMVQEANSRKAKTELLMRKFARIYTPVVFGLAVAIATIPYFFVSDFVFVDWLYRALVFLVISCPCALVISIPLGYFGGIGAASRNGVLFKGANYLEMLTKVNTIVMDKTGTLTKGVFKVQQVVTNNIDKAEFTGITAAMESRSTHPIALAITEYNASANGKTYTATDIEEIAGHGLHGSVEGKDVLVGNAKLLKKFDIAYSPEVDNIVDTSVVVAIDNVYAGYITISDEVKEDSRAAVDAMHSLGIKTVMLSGDKNTVTQKAAQEIGIDKAYGDLLPEDKVRHMEELKADESNIIAFIGDGINDTPVLALSHVGIAMGAMGSDAAIEVADVVIQTDQPSKVITAISIAKATRRIVIQNIVMALTLKIAVMILGAMGIASMWSAVFADVGVAMLAILNSIRILYKKFR